LCLPRQIHPPSAVFVWAGFEHSNLCLSPGDPPVQPGLLLERPRPAAFTCPIQHRKSHVVFPPLFQPLMPPALKRRPHFLTGPFVESTVIPASLPPGFSFFFRFDRQQTPTDRDFRQLLGFLFPVAKWQLLALSEFPKSCVSRDHSSPMGVSLVTVTPCSSWNYNPLCFLFQCLCPKQPAVPGFARPPSLRQDFYS